MLERGKMERGIFEIVDTESLVPKEHLLRTPLSKITSTGGIEQRFRLD